jgi:hypothetical protein
MKAGPLRRKTWLSLREAAARIGQALLNTDWSDRILDRDPSDRTVSLITRDIYVILSSGEVKTLLDEGYHEFEAKFAQYPGFEIDLRENRIRVQEIQASSCCQLNAADLDVFLLKHHKTRFHGQSSDEGRDKCLARLRQLMASPKTKTKSDYKREAKTTFGVSGREFDRIWEQLSADTGGAWSQPGRPKSKR